LAFSIQQRLAQKPLEHLHHRALENTGDAGHQIGLHLHVAQAREPLDADAEFPTAVDGALPIEEFKELFDIEELPEEERYRTVGGLVLAELGRIPSAGESFTFENLKIEVVDMDGNRIDKVLVTQVQPVSAETPTESEG